MEKIFVTHREVLDWIAMNHSRKQDLDEGDLIERLAMFDYFEVASLKLSSIDLGEFSVSYDKVTEYAALSSAPPPVVYDAVSGSMIDGMHRACAARRLGQRALPALKGTVETLEGCKPPGLIVSLSDLLPAPSPPSEIPGERFG